jgi:predicted nuclease of predicted toxin-antitoxin system
VAVLPPRFERILIDECLSPELATLAPSRGYQAHHVVHLGKAGVADFRLVNELIDEGYLVVTRNARDFRRLLSAVELHAGLILLMPNATASQQVALFEAALNFIERMPDTVNKVLEVHAMDDIRVSNLPPADA